MRKLRRTPKKLVMPEELVREYLRVTAKLTPLEKEQKPLKEKIIEYFDKGYRHPALIFTEVDRRQIPWPKIVQELVTVKYAGDEERIKGFYRKLDKRFKPEAINPRIQASGK